MAILEQTLQQSEKMAILIKASLAQLDLSTSMEVKRSGSVYENKRSIMIGWLQKQAEFQHT